MTKDLSPWVVATWTWIGPKAVDGGYTLEASELRDFFVAAATLDDLYADLRPALQDYFESLVEQDDALPEVPHRWTILEVSRERTDDPARLTAEGTSRQSEADAYTPELTRA